MNNENFEICSKCNGSCCKKLPGMMNPNQLQEVNELTLRNKLKEGFQFDYIEGNEPIYYLRPSTIQSIGKTVDASWGGQCIFFKDKKGCSFTFDERPQQCQDLEPKADMRCISSKTKTQYAMEWLPYQEIIKNIIND